MNDLPSVDAFTAERPGIEADGYVSPRSCWPKSAVVDRQRYSSYAEVMPDSPLPAAVNKRYRPIYGYGFTLGVRASEAWLYTFMSHKSH